MGRKIFFFSSPHLQATKQSCPRSLPGEPYETAVRVSSSSSRCLRAHRLASRSPRPPKRGQTHCRRRRRRFLRCRCCCCSGWSRRHRRPRPRTRGRSPHHRRRPRIRVMQKPGPQLRRARPVSAPSAAVDALESKKKQKNKKNIVLFKKIIDFVRSLSRSALIRYSLFSILFQVARAHPRV